MIIYPKTCENLNGINVLKQFGIEDKIIVTEVSEDDYSTREDQIKEIKMLIKMETKK